MLRRLLSVLLLLLVVCAVSWGTESTAAGIVEGLSAACLNSCLAGLRDAVSAPIAALQQRVEEALQQSQPQSPPPSCPDHWLRYDDTCYLIPSEKSTWAAANQACARLDRRARLASIHRHNLRHVAGVLKMTSEAKYVWIGLVRISSEPSTFGWIDGTPFDVSNWAPNEPNNHLNHTEDCVHLKGEVYVELHRYKWNDIPCSRMFNFLCQVHLGDFKC